MYILYLHKKFILESGPEIFLQADSHCAELLKFISKRNWRILKNEMKKCPTVNLWRPLLGDQFRFVRLMGVKYGHFKKL